MKPLLEMLVKERRRQGISQHALDHEIGFTNSLVSRWECGDRTPSAFALFVWAEALGLDIKLEPKQ
jgi:transcriptional regulator with XRE-family HTH domain|tara:strand:- start:2321 stop:2518 length:198 start_codon:yes stop_codon:yes gene_type:complete